MLALCRASGDYPGGAGAVGVMWRRGGLAVSFVVGTVVAAVAVQETAASRILVVDLFGSVSHKNFIMAIAEKLAKRNHSVTYLTGYEPKHVRPNVKEVFVPTQNFFNTLPNLFNTKQWDTFIKYSSTMHTYCSKGLGSKGFQSIKDEEFDLVMLSVSLTDCFLPYVQKLQVPLVYVCPNVVQGVFSDLAGTPHFSSLTASFMLDPKYPLTFTGRMVSTLYDHFNLAMTYWLFLPRIEADCKSHNLCPNDMPRLEKIRLNSSLFITNSVRELENPTLPYPPTVVHAGGIHCRPSQPLPQDLEEWAAGSGGAGFILFSLGSLVKPSDMPEKYRKVLLEVFASLEQRVLWKWHEETMEGLPPNVRLSKWLPQQDILGHPRIRLFMTQGGLLSLQEATYHGVPVLGFPVFVDQRRNVRQAQEEGWGSAMYWEDLTYHHLRYNILDIIQDSRVREEVNRRSSVMRDQPVSPGDWTTYWIEYVIRHRGATHLRCPAVHMPWYQLYNVDVWVVVVVVTVALVVLGCYLSYRSLRCLFAFCCATKKTKRE